MNLDGSINLKIVHKALQEIESVNLKDNVIVLKSTMIPGTMGILAEKYPKLNLVFNPEFLTERTAKLDFLTQARIILGGNPKYTAKVKTLFEERFMHCYVIETNFTTAEMIKYMNNVFFATKVSVMNEFKQICDKAGADWDVAIKGFAADQRIGDSHLNVPGPDGKMGFGGSCFPKDINAFIDFASQLDIEVHTIKGAWATNLEVRPEKDWEKLKGRAIVDKESSQIEINFINTPLIDA
jgi:UDPglucose 6-dehydrogenase